MVRRHLLMRPINRKARKGKILIITCISEFPLLLPPISFKATLRILEAFQPLIALQGHCSVGYPAAIYPQIF